MIFSVRGFYGVIDTFVIPTFVQTVQHFIVDMTQTLCCQLYTLQW